MELRHLRYFVAVAEEGSLTVAAEQRLHTAQPSLSRQIKDLEEEVGVPLFTRSARGVELTAAGRAFLDHARLALGQAEAAIEAARAAGQRAKPTLSIGFLTGEEVEWMPRALAVLRAELPDLEVRVLSMYSPQLAEELRRGKLDVGFLRHEPVDDLEFQTVAQEPLVVLLPSDHPLAKKRALHPRDLVGETYIGVSSVPHVLREVVASYLRRCQVTLTPSHLIDNVSIGISLVASTRGVTLLPAYAESVLPWSVVSRPLEGESPTIDLAVGYRRDNASPILRTFLSRLDALRADAATTSRYAAPRRGK